MFGQRTLRCSFCGKDETQVSKLVAGPKVFICDACTVEAARIISESDTLSPPTWQRQTQRSLLRRLWQALHRQALRCVPVGL